MTYYRVDAVRHGQVRQSNVVSATLWSPGYDTYSVPSSIDPTGSTDVTAALQAWIDSVPDGTEGRPNVLQFGSTGTYLVQTVLNIGDRQNLVLNGDGCSLIRTDNRYCATSLNYAMASATAVGTTATFTTATPFRAIDTHSEIQITGCTPSAYNTVGSQTWPVTEVVSDTVLKATLASDPGGAATVVGTLERMAKEHHMLWVGTDTINGSAWSRNITLRDMTINGPYDVSGTVTWDPDYEFQHGIRIEGVEGLTIENVTVRECHGDGIYNQGRPVGPGLYTPSSSLDVRGSTFYYLGRHGWSFQGLYGGLLKNNVIDQIGRGGISMEPPGVVHGQVSYTVEDLVISSATEGNGAVIYATGSGAPDWGPLVFRRVTFNNLAVRDFFFYGSNVSGDTLGYRNGLTIDDCSFKGYGDASASGLRAAIYLEGAVKGWQNVLVKDSDFEFGQVAIDEGGIRLVNCDSVTSTGCTFTNVYDYGGTPSWYGDGGGNTNISMS